VAKHSAVVAADRWSCLRAHWNFLPFGLTTGLMLPALTMALGLSTVVRSALDRIL
jgi:hypothetical protein